MVAFRELLQIGNLPTMLIDNGCLFVSVSAYLSIYPSLSLSANRFVYLIVFWIMFDMYERIHVWISVRNILVEFYIFITYFPRECVISTLGHIDSSRLLVQESETMP